VTHADAAADLKKENHGHGQCSVEFTIEVVRSSEPARVDAVVEKLVYWPLGFGWWLRLSPIGDPFGNPNPKWVSNTISIASNRVPIQKTHFGYQERQNPNFGILSP